MATPIVVKSLKAFDAELTSVAPKRTLPSWFKGDNAHRNRPSGHNPDDTPGSQPESSDSDNIPEIRAGDFRLPLNAKFTAEQLVQLIVKRCREGKVTWISYIIYNKRIWSAANGWVTRVYNGSNPHDKHFHISSRSDTKSENNTTKMDLDALNRTPAKPKPPAAGQPNVPRHINAAHEVKRGHRGTDVVTIQKELGSKRGIKTVDGVFGEQTEAALKRWQREANLTADGICGPRTWKSLGYKGR